MGREVKRVKEGFEWPLNKIWPGFLISTCIDNCDDCKEAARLRGMKTLNRQ